MPPGVSGFVVQPALVVAAGAVLDALLLERRTVAAGIAYTVALAVAAMMLARGKVSRICFQIGEADEVIVRGRGSWDLSQVVTGGWCRLDACSLRLAPTG